MPTLRQAAGLVNGAVGTVRGIKIDKHDRARVTVELDAAKGEKAQRVSFIVGGIAADEFNSFKHGYAGTIYKGQGRTLDQVYVGHSAQWRSSAAYVALSRHKESVVTGHRSQLQAWLLDRFSSRRRHRWSYRCSPASIS